ncbi:MAG: 4Fe-4S dicluster domain-containing protein [Lachnospiraceae bacterium]|nr:4Fe-4S dicluster domain-containing protein [Lachnospiraceae bacterium]
MDIKELTNIIKENGVVGAGGAGFPTYAKLDSRADTILLNCAECEPLLKLHRQLLAVHADEILGTFSLIADTLGAERGIIGIKADYKETLRCVEGCIGRYPKLSVHKLPGAYPQGDEVVLIYETTGRVVNPGGLPIEQGVVVFNVETVYNVYRAMQEKTPVVDKLVTVVGEVEHPVTVRVPLGMKLSDVVSRAGNITTKDPVYLVGGPMMGRIGKPEDPVTKTTNALLILPSDHKLILKMTAGVAIDMKRAASVCCQCRTCTDMCPRYLLGHPIEPHKFMRSAANMDVQDTSVFMDTFFCSSCGTCELYACPQGLSPRTLIAACKNGLRSNGIKPEKGIKPRPVNQDREYRRAQEGRLTARLGLTDYDLPAPMDESVQKSGRVVIRLSQHIGAPAVACVKTGDRVRRGQKVAEPGQGLSVPIHASIDGVVSEVTQSHVVIEDR